MRALAIAELLPSPPAPIATFARPALRTIDRTAAATTELWDTEADLLLEQAETTRNILALTWHAAFQAATSSYDATVWALEEAFWTALRSAADTERRAAELRELRLAQRRSRARAESFAAMASAENPFLG